MTMSDGFAGETVPEVGNEGMASPNQVKNLGLETPIELTPEDELLFEELIMIGRRQKQVRVAGHHILLSTMNTDVELQIGLLTKEFMGSDAYARAYKAAVVAASVTEIDGRPVYQPLSPGEEDTTIIVRKKFERVREYYPIIVDMIYNHVMELEQELFPLVEKLKKM